GPLDRQPDRRGARRTHRRQQRAGPGRHLHGGAAGDPARRGGQAGGAAARQRGPAMTPSCAVERTILVVEDDPEILESLCDVLELEGYQVVAASNGQQALEQLRRMSRPCLVLLDLMLPVMDGKELLATIRQTDV